MRGLSACGVEFVKLILCAVVLSAASCSSTSTRAASARSAAPGSDSEGSTTMASVASAPGGGGDEEVRAMFVSFAYNIDWPSQPSLPSHIQENEIDAIIQRAVDLNCNTIFLQVRAFGDRIYRKTNTEFASIPWAMALAYTNAPEPATYDPLGSWITKCHANGIQLIAWMNPFRTDWPVTYQGTVLPYYASPDGNHMYLDSSYQSVQDYAVAVMDDLLTQYQNSPTGGPGSASGGPGGDDDGLDGIVIDHYFPNPDDPTGVGAPAGAGPSTAPGTGAGTPAPGTAAKVCGSNVAKPPTTRIAFLLQKNNMPLPANTNKVSLDKFIEAAFTKVDGHKRIFAISPCLNQTEALNQYVHADKWLKNGWCHYCIPEIYQRDINDFKNSLDWWINQNTFTHASRKTGPQVFPAIYSAAVEKGDSTKTFWTAAEVQAQVDAARDAGVGQALYTWRALRTPAHAGPKENVGEKLKEKQYVDKPLLPEAMLAPVTLPAPDVTVSSTIGKVDVSMPGGTTVRWWAYRLQKGGNPQKREFISGKETQIPTGGAKHIKVWAIDRYNRTSPPKDLTLP